MFEPFHRIRIAVRIVGVAGLVVAASIIGCNPHRPVTGARSCDHCESTEYCAVRGKSSGETCEMSASCKAIPAECLLPPMTDSHGYSATCACLEDAESATYPSNEADRLIFGCGERVDFGGFDGGTRTGNEFSGPGEPVDAFRTIRSTVYDPDAPEEGQQCL